jgi:hypothetical protein
MEEGPAVLEAYLGVWNVGKDDEFRRASSRRGGSFGSYGEVEALNRATIKVQLGETFSVVGSEGATDVGVGVALMGRPKLPVLDEPSLGLAALIREYSHHQRVAPDGCCDLRRAKRAGCAADFQLWRRIWHEIRTLLKPTWDWRRRSRRARGQKNR